MSCVFICWMGSIWCCCFDFESLVILWVKSRVHSLILSMFWF